jgi:hypothetical protein
MLSLEKLEKDSKEVNGTGLERPATEGESPVCKNHFRTSGGT